MCLALLNPEAFKIVETDVFDEAYRVMKQRTQEHKESLVRFTSGVWKPT